MLQLRSNSAGYRLSKYCKNLTLLVNRHVIQMVSLLPHVGSGIDAGKFFEIVDKMGLIEIATAGSHVPPGKVCAGPNLLQNLLETPYARKELWRKAYFVGEKLDKATGADADVAGKVGNGRSSMNIAEKTQRAIDGAMALERPQRLRQQALFKDLEFLFWRARFKQTLPQQSCLMAPQIFE